MRYLESAHVLDDGLGFMDRYRLLRRLTLMMPNDFFDMLRQLGNVPIEKLKPAVQASPLVVVGHRHCVLHVGLRKVDLGLCTPIA